MNWNVYLSVSSIKRRLFMLQSGEILVSDQLNNDELEFIINQSFELFCKLRNYTNLSLNNVFFSERTTSKNVFRKYK